MGHCETTLRSETDEPQALSELQMSKRDILSHIGRTSSLPILWLVKLYLRNIYDQFALAEYLLRPINQYDH